MKLTQEQANTIINGVINYERYYSTSISYYGENENEFYLISGNMYTVINFNDMTIEFTYYEFNETDLEETLDFWKDWEHMEV
jgi:hypothetical protein